MQHPGATTICRVIDRLMRLEVIGDEVVHTGIIYLRNSTSPQTFTSTFNHHIPFVSSHPFHFSRLLSTHEISMIFTKRGQRRPLYACSVYENPLRQVDK